MPLNEGQTVQYTVITTRVADGTVLYWKTTGNTTNSDIVGGNTGSITITNNQAVFNVTTSADVNTDGTKTLGISISTGSQSGPTVGATVNPITVNDTSLSPAPIRLYSWGSNSTGELGLNDRVNRSSPAQVGTGTNWSLISFGYNNVTIATKTDGTLWAWGPNTSGQLGLNDRVNRSSPVQVGTGTNWSQVGAGRSTIATKTDGTLWTWGPASFGLWGSNSTAGGYRSSPVQVGALTNWNSVSLKRNSVAATKNDGTLWSWGQGSDGQLGLNNTISEVSSPTQVGTGTNWSLVSVGQYSVVATKTDGTLWTWGDRRNGQLGQNNSFSRSSPVQVGTETNWSQVDTNFAGAVLATKTDGTLWTWGNNNVGQLGQNNLISRSSPVQVGTGTNWNLVNVGQTYSAAATKTDGTLWAWGRNVTGELGQNDAVVRSSPVQVGTGTNWSLLRVGSGIMAAITTN